MTRSKHSEDFKKEAVRLVIRNNRKTKQVAGGNFLGIIVFNVYFGVCKKVQGFS